VIVVDTNVIAYLMIPGDLSLLAETTRQNDPVWIAPILWRSEMRNVLMLYLRQKLMTLSDSKSYMAKAEQILSGSEYEVDSARVLELAANYGCTAYDCEFVYLAEKLDIPLVTSDKKLIAAFPQIAVSMKDFVNV
jgi:predicted nucleic acid-binding protein